MKNFFKKGFDIQIEDTLNYPSADKVCKYVEEFCSADNQKCEFVSKNNPVTFRLDGILYKTTVNMSRGGYCLLCKEV